MNKNKPLKLHLGCGNTYFEGYVNIDYPQSEHTVMKPVADVFADFTKLEYAPGSVDEIRAHHVFEHFNRAEALKLLFQWRKWLKPNGVLHLETPDFDMSLLYYALGSWKTKMEVGRHMLGSQEAKWAYHLDFWSRRKFRYVLRTVGFADIRISQRSNSFSKYFNTPLFNIIGFFIPRFVYRRFGGNKLPNITVVAKKTDVAINEHVIAEHLLKDYLVGTEGKELLDVWMKQVFG